MCNSEYKGCVHPDNVQVDNRTREIGQRLGTGGGSGGLLGQGCEARNVMALGAYHNFCALYHIITIA